MFCIIKKFKEMHKELSNLSPKEAEIISVDGLPLCMACINFQNLSYSEILSSENLHIYLRYIYVLIIGMHSVSDTYATSLFELLANPPDDEILLKKQLKDNIHKTFEAYHLFYDVLLRNYPLHFDEKIEHEQIHLEIQQYGFYQLLTSKDLKIKHIIHHTHLMMMNNQYLEALEWLIDISFALMHSERHSFARSKHIFMDKQILLIGSALTEGEAEYFAIKLTQEFLNKFNIPITNCDSRNYVIERRMYKLLHDKCNIPETEGICSLFDASNSFLNNPCLFPKILKSSDELNLLKYKKLLAEIVI